MSEGIKYHGIEGRPVLNTSGGRFPSRPRSQEPGENILAPQGMLAYSQGEGLRLALRLKEQERVLAEVRRRLMSLRDQIDNLQVPASDLVSRARTALSQQPRALAATADELASAPARYTLQVYHPGAGGQILSDQQNPVAAVSLTPGTYGFSLTVDDSDYELEVSVLADDNQQELLERIARAINSQDPAISAEVKEGTRDAYDPAPGSRPLERYVQLKITTTAAGQGPRFYLQDTSGELISSYGLDSGRPGRAAFLRLGGALRSQSSDDISLDAGHVNGQVAAASEGPFNLEVTAGAGPITAELSKLISDYNSLVSLLDSHADLLRPSLKDRIVRPLEDRAALLPALDIVSAQTGRMSLGPRFPELLKSDFASLRQVLLSEEGWVPALAEKLDQILQMEPDAFAQPLAAPRALSDRKQVMAALAGVTSSLIINGYY